MSPTLKLGIAGAIIAAVIISTYAVLEPSPSQGNTSESQVSDTSSSVVRIGYFPNINHAQAVIGLGNGDFQKALGNVDIETKIFNAGPSAIEALFANAVDMTYIGPNPAINGYVTSNGEALRIVAGAASGGVVFVVRNDADINSIEDFAGKTFASPQLGNTQDVALRAYLLQNGYKTTENGGNITVKPAKNSDIFTLMVKKEIDGAWVPEPWGAKLVREANARIFLDERDLWPSGKFVTAHVIVSTKYLKEHPDIVEKVIKAHVDETNWINEHPDDASRILNEQIEKLTGQRINEDELKDALSRLEFTYDPIRSSLLNSAEDAFELGYLGETKPDISNIYDLTLLNKVLLQKDLNRLE
jgi:NitT/TauT family transport system substrate-binding protein